MGELLKEQTDWPEETWLNLLQHATQSEIDTFLAMLQQNGMKIIEVKKYDQMIEMVNQAIKEIESLEYRIKTLMKPC